jgi:hypothetical protein
MHRKITAEFTCDQSTLPSFVGMLLTRHPPSALFESCNTEGNKLSKLNINICGKSVVEANV